MEADQTNAKQSDGLAQRGMGNDGVFVTSTTFIIFLHAAKPSDGKSVLVPFGHDVSSTLKQHTHTHDASQHVEHAHDEQACVVRRGRKRRGGWGAKEHGHRHCTSPAPKTTHLRRSLSCPTMRIA